MASPWSLLYGLLLDKASLAKALTSELMLMKGRARASIANSTCASSVMPCATVIVVQVCDLRSTRHMHIYENHWKSTRVLTKEKLPELGHRWLQDWNSYLGRSIWKYSVSDRDSKFWLLSKYVEPVSWQLNRRRWRFTSSSCKPLPSCWAKVMCSTRTS